VPGTGSLGHLTVSVGAREKDKGAAVKMSGAEAGEAARRLDAEGVVILGYGEEGTALLSRGTLKRLNASADRVEGTVCEALERRGLRFRGGSPGGGGQGGQGSEGSGGSEGSEGGGRKRGGGREYAPFSFAEAASRCLGRVDVRMRAPGFDEEAFRGLETCASWLPLVRRALGDEAVLAYAGLVLSFPGSVAQPWHVDGPHLFGTEEGTGLQCPPHALNVFVPLEDVDERLGPTEFLVGTHRLEVARTLDLDFDGGRYGHGHGHGHGGKRVKPEHPCVGELDGEAGATMARMISPRLRAGTALVYDYRTVHRGVPNSTGSQGTAPRTRKMLYLLYARPWFRDHINFGTESLLDANKLRAEAQGHAEPGAKRPRDGGSGDEGTHGGRRSGSSFAPPRAQGHGRERGGERRPWGRGRGGGWSGPRGSSRGGQRNGSRSDSRHGSARSLGRSYDK